MQPSQDGALVKPRFFKRRRALAGVVAVIFILGGVGGYYGYQNSLQPNMQITTMSIAQPLQSPASSTVVDLGRVTSSGSFSYTATMTGNYVLTFDNHFSDYPKSLAVTYSVAGGANIAQSFNIPAGDSQTITVSLAAGQSVSGSFSVAGGPQNNIAFSIVSDTCTESVSFSFAVVNGGSANGFANIAFTSDGQTAWTNRYYAQTGQQLPVSGTVTINDCASHTFNIALASQQKA